jgi:hypothetical protein
MLNDTSVLSAHACILHTLLDVIPLVHTAPRVCMSAIPIVASVHVCLFGSAQGGQVHLKLFERAS